MNAKDLRPIHKELLARLPGFASHKRLLLMTPMRGMLRAITFQPSAFSKDDFQVMSMLMPLCVPTEYFWFLLTGPIRAEGGLGWTLKNPDLIEDLDKAIQVQALSFLRGIRSPDEFAEAAVRSWGNPHSPKGTAYLLARDGQYTRAVAIIDKLLPTLDLDVAWERGIFDDTTNLRHMLLTDPDEARRKLAEWENYTIGKLKLEAFR